MVSVLLCWSLLIGNQAVFAEEGDAGQDAAQKEEITKEVQKTDDNTAAAAAKESKDEDTVAEVSDTSDTIEPKTEKEESAPAASEEQAAEEPAAVQESNEQPKKSAKRAVQNDVITKIEALLSDGSGPVGDISQWQVFRLNAKFALPNGQVHAGDTTTITLPEKLRFDQTAGFDITDEDGNVVARATINGPNKTINIVYTDFVENHSDITGKFHVYVKVDRDKVDEAEDIPLNIDVNGNVVYGGDVHFIGIPTPTAHMITKGGWQLASDDHRTITFNINVNTSGNEIKDAKIEDFMKNEGVSIVPSSLQILKGTWAAVHGDWEITNSTDITSQCEVTWGEGNKSYVISLGDIAADEGIRIRYNAVTEYDMVDGEVIRNDATLTGTEIRNYNASANATFYEAGGSAEGYVYSIRLHKEDEDGNSLAGAVFEVTRQASGQVVGRITTGSDGYAEVKGLLKDTYEIREITAPTGFVPLQEPLVVGPSDFGSDRVAPVTAVNKMDKISIPVEKTWVGTPADSVKITLTADGNKKEEVELTANGDWKHTFRDLPKYDPADGHEITYDVQEEDLEGYTSGRSGTAEDGFTFTNTISGKVSVPVTKVWEGPSQSSVTIDLLADGNKVDSVELSSDNNWQHTFRDLEKYDNGKEIEYTISEPEVNNYKTEITGNAQDGYTVTNVNTETTSVDVTKKWVGNQADAIVVRLFADGEEVDSATITDGTDWKHSFRDLPVYNKDGSKIEYTITEDGLDGYDTEITGDAEKGYVVTNTEQTTPEEPTPPEESLNKKTSKTSKASKNSSNPDTGDTNNLLASMAALLVSVGLLTALLLHRRKMSKTE